VERALERARGKDVAQEGVARAQRRGVLRFCGTGEDGGAQGTEQASA
jgi:hypothetical protein